MAQERQINYGINFNVNQNSLNAVKASLNEIQRLTGDKLIQMNPDLKLGDAVDQLTKVKATANTVQEALDKAFNQKLGTLNLTEFNSSLSSAGLNLKQIYTQFSSIGTTGQQAFRNLTTELLTTNLQLKETHSLLDNMATTMSNTIKWGIASSAMNSFTGAVSKAYNYIVKLDTSLNDIRIVTEKSAADMNSFAVDANKAAQRLGSTTRDFADAALIYYQQGLSDEESKARAEVTIKAANVTGQTGQEVSEQLTAVWNGYKVTADEAELYVDKLAAVAASTAADLEELSTGMSKVASAADLMGVDVDQLNAQLATIVSVTRQAPESVGVALKTIYARMGDIEAGLDDETTLGNYTSEMAALGINVLDANNKLRDMGEVIEEIGGKWTSMTREQQIALSQTMAGTRQYNNLLSLFDNWGMYTEALETSKNSMGTLQKQQDIYMESTQAHLDQMNAAFENLYDSILDEDTIKDFADMIGGAANAFANLVDAMGGGGNALLAFGSIATRIFSKNLAQGLATTINNFRALRENVQQTTSTLQILQELKGIGIDDAATKTVIDMKQQIMDLGDVVTEEQNNEANAIIRTTNELARQVEEWERTKEVAQQFIQDNTVENVDINFSDIVADTEDFDKVVGVLDAVDDQVKKTDKEIKNYQQTIKSTIERESEYLDTLEDEIVDNEKIKKATEEKDKAYKKLKSSVSDIREEMLQLAQSGTVSEQNQQALLNAINEYNKEMANPSADPIAAAQKLLATYQSVNDNIKQGAIETRQTLDNQVSGTGEKLANELNRIQTQWNAFIAQSQTAQIAKQFVDLAGTIGQITAGMNALINVINVWNNQDLSTGEKMLQTFMALTTAIPMLINGFMTLTPTLYGVMVSLGLVKVAEDGVALSATQMWTAMLGPVALVVAAIAAVVIVVGSLVDLISNYQTEEEKLEERVKKTQEAVTEANDAYKELNDTINSYTSAKDKIKELEEGTIEFYEAIIATNEKAQELIDTLGLLPGSGYTIDANGLINLDKDTLQDSLYRQMQEVYKNQAKNSQARADLERYNRDEIVSNFRDEINQEARKQNINANITKEQAEKILENSSKTNISLGELTNIYRDYNTSFDKNFNGLENSFEKSNADAADNICSAVGQNAIDISSAITKYMPGYNASTEKINVYETQSAIANIRGYVSQEDAKKFNNLSTGAQEAAAQILNTRIKNYKPNEQVPEWKTGDAQFHWWDALTLGGTYFGRKLALDSNNKQLREEYLKNSKGFTEQNGTWINPEGKTLSKKELEQELNSIDAETARQAYNSGEYYTKATYENNIAPTIERAASLAKERGLDSTSQTYIEEALLRLQAGTADDKFFNKLTDEERQALASQRGQKITMYSDGTQETSDTIQGVDIASKYSSEDIDKWLELTGEVDRSAERIKADLEDYNNTLADSASQLDTTSKALEFYGQAMYNASGEVNKMDKTSAETIADQYKFNKSFNEAVEVYYNNEDAIKEYQKALKNNEDISYDVADAMGELAESLEDMGLSLDAQTITDNLDDVKKLLTGTEEEAEAAYQKLLKLGQIDALENMFGPAENALSSFGMAYDTLINGISTTNPGTYLADNYASALQKMIEDTHLTAEQIQQLADQLNIEIPVEYNAPDELAIKDNEYTTAAVTTAHTYSGQIPVSDASEKKGYRLETIDYSWYETTEPKTEHFLTVDKTKMRVNQSSQSLGGKRNFALSQPNKKAKEDSGSKKDPKQIERIDEEADRYHQVDTQISKVEKSLSKLQSQTDKYFGSKKIDNLNKQWDLLNTQIKNYNDKLIIAQQEEDELRNKLSRQGVSFNADGTISNYMAAFQAQENYVNSLIDQYNRLSAEQQEVWDKNKTIDNAKENFNKFKENMDRYDELISDFIPELQQNIQDAIDEQIDLRIQEFNMEIEIRLNMAEAERDWNEFKKRVIDGIDEDDILGNARARLLDFSSYYNADGTGQVQALTKQVNGLLDQLYQQDGTDWATAYGDNRAQALEDLKDYYDQLKDSLMDILDLQEEIHDAYIDMIDEAADKFGDQVEMYETVRDLIEHDMNVIELVYGEEAYGALSKYYERQEENYNKQLDFQRQQKDFWYAQMQIMEEGSEEWEAAKENWLDAVDEWNSAVEDAIENLQDKYLNAINEIFQKLNNEVTAGKGLDYTNQEWELINKNAEQYLDTVDAAWSIQKLENKYMDAYDATDSIQARRQIKEIMDEELANLREQDKLTEYDIERANMRYDIMLKQIALQEAQQNKSKTRLRRDSQGNYRYEFVADDDEIGNLQDELGDLYNSLYDFDKEKYQDNLNQLYEIWVEFQEAMTEAAQINDPVARAERELLIRQQYEPLLNGILQENLDIRANLEQSAFDDLAYLYAEDAENFRAMTEEEKDAFLADLIPAWTSGIQQMADTMTGEGGFLPTVRDSLDEIDGATREYEDSLVDLQNSADQSFTDIHDNIDNTITQTQDLIWTNEDLINSYRGQLDAIREVIGELTSLINQYKAAESAAKAATDAAYKYWQEQQRQAAAAASKNSASVNGGGGGSSGSGSGAGGNSGGSGGGSGRGDGRLSVGDTATYTGKYYYDSYGTAPAGSKYSGVANGIVVDILNNNPYGVHIHSADGKYRDLGWIKRSQLSGYDTGGYTGEWGNTDGKLALLHQKELVLNSTDTQNILNAVNVMRGLSGAMLDRLSMVAANSNTGTFDGEFEQNVHIEANFPNVQNSHEIEDAIDNLMNRASQRINKRG